MSEQFGAGPRYSPSTPMPAEPLGGATSRGPAPGSVLNAVGVMFARAALGVVNIIVLLATKNTLKHEILKKHPSYDPSKLTTVLNAAIGVGVVVAIIFLVLYVLMALQVRNGKNWARIVALILAGLGVLGVLAIQVQTQTAPTRVVSVISGVLDLLIIVFLTQRASSEFFRDRA